MSTSLTHFQNFPHVGVLPKHCNNEVFDFRPCCQRSCKPPDQSKHAKHTYKWPHPPGKWVVHQVTHTGQTYVWDQYWRELQCWQMQRHLHKVPSTTSPVLGVPILPLGAIANYETKYEPWNKRSPPWDTELAVPQGKWPLIPTAGPTHMVKSGFKRDFIGVTITFGFWLL